MFFGVDYYPEHWEEERWETDAKLMKEAQINVVRLAEFAWCRLEKEEGVFDFDWLDKAIEILSKYGIKVILGTPSAALPRWLQEKYPEVLAADFEGKRFSYGGRRDYCPNSKILRYYLERIVTKLAQRYGNNPNVIGWQIDNELGGENSACHCENCENEFKSWVKKKYKTIENLNKEWGLVFWSHELSSFEEVFIPRKAVSAHNPSLLLNYKRFMSDSFINFAKFQTDILKRYISENQIITHNFMGAFDEIDYHKLGSLVDVVGYDCYHAGFWAPPPKWSDVSFHNSIMKGLKNKNFWMIEQQSGAGGWQIIGDNPRPGEIKLWSYHSIAEGADALIYFRWRTATFGMEEYWHGVLDHDGVPRRRYQEVQKVGQELKNIGNIIENTNIKTDIAILRSYDNSWVFKIQPHNKALNYNNVSSMFYKAFRKQNYMVDTIFEDADFSKYKVIVAPLLIMPSSKLVEKLYDFAKNGGRLILSYRSGVKDIENKILKIQPPGPFKELIGAEVFEYDAFFSRKNSISSDIIACSSNVDLWADILETNTAKPLAYYKDDYMKDKIAITENSFGNGKVYYIGSMPNDEFLKKLSNYILKDTDIKPIYQNILENIVFTERYAENYKLTFILNYENKEYEIDNSFIDGYDIITNEQYGEKIKLKPFDVKIIKTNL
ncbi:beta-galactosidase [Caldicellulosiruptoraceae bacterium PP1]